MPTGSANDCEISLRPPNKIFKSNTLDLYTSNNLRHIGSEPSAHEFQSYLPGSAESNASRTLSSYV
ncbi:hypothetical protein I7I50_04302 [Histoplasma capsulatum G186AR]|uniref:Uncharacterized protein n=1 Tax=Ajellomyces capsulatus TaxID=5037 RepID=A0A8H7YM80_AJECA|nr:hypothetical protein I7I52_05210 [Histoplasma capsulatum]QSS75233.1 hypothetical protein I7I50_04302 [Histoplasma capsulatum G186AR]